MIRKIVLVVAVVALNSNQLFSQAPVWQWAYGSGGIGTEQATANTTDVAGNIYTAVYFDSNTDFDPGPGTYSLPAGGGSVAIVKSTSDGNFIRAVVLKVNNSGNISGMQTDPEGNLYASGYFTGTGDFDPGPSVLNLTSNGSEDIFVVKLDSSGNLIWARSLGGTEQDGADAVAVDFHHNVYLIGSFIDSVDFDPSSLSIFSLTASLSGSDIFITKLDSNGDFVWVKQIAGDEYDYGTDIAIDGQENIYLTGTFGDIVDFNPDTATFILTASGTTDAFICKLTASGTFIWAKSLGGTGLCYSFSLALDGNNNIYTTGVFTNTCDFNPGTGIYVLTSHGIRDCFISKLDSNGSFIYAKSFGGIGYDYSFSIASDFSGNVFTTGYFTDTADFGTDSLQVYNVISAGGEELFVLKLNPDGAFAWVKANEGASNEEGSSITLGNNGEVFVCGWFYLLPFNMDTFTLTPVGQYDMFSAKMKDTPNGNEVREISINDITVFPNPATGFIIIQLNTTSTKAHVALTNTLGQVVQTAVIDAQTKVISIQTLPAGIYFVHVQTENGSVVRKVLKQ